MRIITLDLDFLGEKSTIAAFLIQTEKGNILIEAGPHSCFEALKSAALKHDVRLEDIKHVFLSHIHFDYAGAAWALAEMGATIYVHPKGAPHLAQPEKLYNSAAQIYGEQMERLWGIMKPIPEEKIYVPTDGESISVLGLTFRAHFTPGHAVHHIAWEVLPEKASARSKSVVFTGDVAGVRIKKSIVMPPCPPPDIDIEAWKESISLLKSLEAKAFFLTHYGKITDIPEHLSALEMRLDDWAGWMKPHYEAGTADSEIVLLFEAYVKKQLQEAGVKEADVAKYQGANPAFMSVAGLKRYFKVKSRG